MEGVYKSFSNYLGYRFCPTSYTESVRSITALAENPECGFCRLRQLVIGIRNAVPDSFVSSTSPATFESKIKTVALFTNYGLIVKDAYDVAAFKKRSKTGQKKFFILASLYLGLSRRTIVPFRQNNSL